jgi:hypothetical protein
VEEAGGESKQITAEELSLWAATIDEPKMHARSPPRLSRSEGKLMPATVTWDPPSEIPLAGEIAVIIGIWEKKLK